MINNFYDFINEHKLHKNQYQLLDYIEKLSYNKTFVILDTETTGLGGYKKQQLTQISAIGYNYDFKNNNFIKLKEFNKKIKISSDIKQRLKDPSDNIKSILKFNRYGNKIENDTKYYNEIDIINEFNDWLSVFDLEPLLIIQNATFDMNMLVGRGKNIIGKNNKTYEILDTKQLIQLFIIPIVQKLSEIDNNYNNILLDIGTSERDNGLISSSMSQWAPKFFNINMSNYHDSLSDCKITSELFIKIVDFIKNNSDLNIAKYQVERILYKN